MGLGWSQEKALVLSYLLSSMKGLQHLTSRAEYHHDHRYCYPCVLFIVKETGSRSYSDVPPLAGRGHLNSDLGWAHFRAYTFLF